MTHTNLFVFILNIFVYIILLHLEYYCSINIVIIKNVLCLIGTFTSKCQIPSVPFLFIYLLKEVFTFFSNVYAKMGIQHLNETG